MNRALLFIPLLAFSASGAVALPFPGEVFPEFDTAERCTAMAASSQERIRLMSEVCFEREAEYKVLAKSFWTKVPEEQRGECEVAASLALGSYEILSNCLRDQLMLAGATE